MSFHPIVRFVSRGERVSKRYEAFCVLIGIGVGEGCGATKTRDTAGKEILLVFG
jgi:hypothetical protein